MPYLFHLIIDSLSFLPFEQPQMQVSRNINRECQWIMGINAEKL
jgi:hypothetical protein